MKFPIPPDDDQRIEHLKALSLLDTRSDTNIDRVVNLCRLIFDVPIAAVTIVSDDRQWFKSIEGLDICETDRDVAFCNYTILSDQVFEVTDALDHDSLKHNPLVTGDPRIRYYAGAPLIHEGYRLGALCLIDYAPRPALAEAQREILTELAAIVVREIRIQRTLRSTAATLASSTTTPAPEESQH